MAATDPTSEVLKDADLDAQPLVQTWSEMPG